MKQPYRLENNFEEIFALKPDPRSDLIQSIVGETKLLSEGITGAFELSGINFGFPTHQVFRDLNLKVARRERIGITGPNGVGKTSLLTLIRGLSHPQSGNILYDGHPISDYSSNYFTSQVAFLSDHEDLFQGTIMENLTLFRVGLTETAIQAAILIGIHELIKNLPKGYQTEVGRTDDASLPKGLQQRIAIARVLVNQPRILLLDDANNADDQKGDESLRLLLDCIKHTLTLVIVSHRLSILKTMDRVFEIKNPNVSSACVFREQIRDEISMSTLLGNLKAKQISMAVLSKRSDVMAAVSVMLTTLGWTGSERELIEAYPQGDSDLLDITGVQNFMLNLGFISTLTRKNIIELSNSELPCLFIPDQQTAKVIFKKEADNITLYDAINNQTVERPKESLDSEIGYCLRFRRVPENAKDLLLSEREDWCGAHILRYQKFLNIALLMTLFSNLLMLSTPLFVMAVYDRVIGTHALDTLVYLTIGIIAVYGLDTWIRRIRTQALEHVGARFSYAVGNDVLKKILGLPCLLSERTGINTHLARVRDIEQLREFISGPMMVSLMDLPFAVLGIIVIAVIAGYLSLVPILGILFYFFLSYLLLEPVRRRIQDSSKFNAIRQELLLETVNKLPEIKELGAELIWLNRYVTVSMDAIRSGYRSAVFSAFVMSLSHGASLLLGLATVGFGMHRVMNGDLTTGGLIASMILVWRIISPLQTTFIAISRIGQVRSSAKQVNRLMKQDLEKKLNWIDPQSIQHLRGEVLFSHVSVRFSPDSHPALMNVSFLIKPGELVAIIGDNGAGKSTVMKLIAGLYSPQTGSIRIDAYDIRQFDPMLLRQTIGYMSQMLQFFDGTIAENIRLAKPEASDAEIRKLIDDLGAGDQLTRLPDGLETMINSRDMSNFSTSFLVDLSFARAIIKKPVILLLDEPVTGLDFESEQRFMKHVQTLKGKSTVFLATHRPSHLKLADKVLHLQMGAVRYFGGPEAFLKKKG